MINFLLSFLLLFSINPNDKSFEGCIKIVQESCYETSFYTYFVKNEDVRIDKFDDNNKHTQSIILNLNNKQVHVLSPIK